MSKETVDRERRRFLATATVAAGGVGSAFAAVPFVKSWNPSAKALAAGAPVPVDISKLKEGEQMIVEWRRKPVWIIKRSKEDVANLAKVTPKLRDVESDKSIQPDYAKNQHRSIKPEILVLVGVCTHLGCSPKFRPEPGSISEDWQGGFFCPCHGSSFDLAGRVYQGVPAPLNMRVPPYAFVNDDNLVIGVNPDDDLSEYA